jgi:hypothetical protein
MVTAASTGDCGEYMYVSIGCSDTTVLRPLSSTNALIAERLRSPAKVE